jgi:hypothetical protein
MEYVDLFQIISQVFPFIGAQDTQGQADECPQMNNRIIPTVMFAQFMDLGMTVVTPGNAVICAGCFDLCVFDFAVFKALVFEPGLQETAAAAATIVVRSVGLHVYKIFFSHNRFHNESKVLGNGIAIAFSNYLAGVLNREFYFEVFVPVRVNL